MSEQERSEISHENQLDGTFRTILADPNWSYNNFGAAKHGAAKAHYNCQSVEDICKIPVSRWARKNSTLLMWGTLTKPDQAIDVIRAWGFNVVTSIPWVKTVPSSAELAKGIGFWWYSTTEILYVCRRGKTKAPAYKSFAEKPDGLLHGTKDNAIFYARRGAHSRKPLSLIEWIESYFPGPLLELYATGKRPGWTCIGLKTGWLMDEQGAHIVIHEPDKRGE